MKNLEKPQKIVTAIAIGMCLISFILSEFMYIKSTVSADKIAVAIGGSGSLTILEAILGRLILYANPFALLYLLFSIFVYMWPAISVLLLSRWLFLQLAVLVATAALLRYDLMSISGNYASLANGCNACETHGFVHFLAAGAILAGSSILFAIASYVESFLQKK